MSFPATRLSVVERTRSGDEETRRVALATIIEAYWKPAYKYLRVKWSLDPDEAADLTQEFFTGDAREGRGRAVRSRRARGFAPICACASTASPSTRARPSAG